MKKKKTYPPLEEEEGRFANEPALEAYAYPTSSIAEEADIDFNGKDLGLPRTLEEIEVELREAERDLKDASKWMPLCDFISDFKKEHAEWLK